MEVSGSHTYKRPGRYRITCIATISPPPWSRRPVVTGPVFYSTAAVEPPS